MYVVAAGSPHCRRRRVQIGGGEAWRLWPRGGRGDGGCVVVCRGTGGGLRHGV